MVGGRVVLRLGRSVMRAFVLIRSGDQSGI